MRRLRGNDDLRSPEQKTADLIDLKKRSDAIRRNNQPEPEPQEERVRTRMQIAGLIVTAALVAAGWFLVQGLGSSTAIEDCLMAGRGNCMRIDAPPRQ